MLAILIAGVLGLLAAVHAYWAIGGARGRDAAVPQRANGARLFTPRTSSTWAVAAALAVAATLVLAAGGWWQISLPSPALRILCGLLALAFLLRGIGDFRWVGLFKRERHGRFARLDSWAYSPLCIGLAVALALVVY